MRYCITYFFFEKKFKKKDLPADRDIEGLQIAGGKIVTISSYQVDSVLRVYTRQNNTKSPAASRPGGEDSYRDKVTLSEGESGRPPQQAYEKISYSILDIIHSGRTEK